MKKFTTVFAMLATILVACNKEGATVTDGTVKVSINASDAASKVEFGELNAGKRPVIWSAEGEDISLWEFADRAYTQAPVSESFVRNEADKSHATFTAVLNEGSASNYDYVAVYPSSVSRTGNRSSAPTSSCISYALSVTATDMQKPSANGPDKNWMVLTSVKTGLAEQPGSMALAFEHQTAYGKMTFKNFPLAEGETITKITVEGPVDRYFVGRRWYDYATGEVTAYSATAQKNFFSIDPSGLEQNSSNFDIWFSILPASLAVDETLKIIATTTKATRVAEIKLPRAINFIKGQVADFTINWSNYINTDKTLVFDFACDALDGWPTGEWATSSEKGGSKTCVYPLGGVNYTFKLIEPSFAASGKIYWNNTAHYLFFGKYRYFSLPLIDGYVLKTVKCTVGKQIAQSSVAIMDHVFNNATAADPDSYAVAAQAWNVAAGTIMTYAVDATNPDQQYYLYCKNPSGGTCFSALTLTYSPVE